MAESTTSSHGYGIEPRKDVPTARIFPEEQTKVIGSVIRLDGRASLSPDGEELTYLWEIVETPLGSSVNAVDGLEEDGSVVTLTPDLLGPYTIGLTVSSDSRTSDRAVATIDVQSILVPHTAQLTPDASFMFDVLSSFWRLINEREVYPVLWSGYSQVIASDLLRMFQIDFAKSIATIQPLYQRRWLDYSPKLELNSDLLFGVFGYEQSGDGAFTGTASGTTVGIIISDRELILLEGAPATDAVGSSLRVFSSNGAPGNIGTYTINRISSNGDGYIVSAATPFPSPEEEIITQGTDLATFVGDDEVRSFSLDFVALGVAIGDVLRIESGGDSGLSVILGVGTPDGLVNDRTLLLDAPTLSAKSNAVFTIFRPVRATFQRAETPTTDTVFIPEADADMTVYETSSFSGLGTIEGVFEIIVEARHVLDALVGKTIKVDSGTNGGRTLSIAAVNSSRTGYIIGASFVGVFPQQVSYTIPLVADITSRLFVLDDRAHKILSAVLDTNQPSIADGGRGPLWVVTLASAAAPSAREGMVWRIANSLISEDATTDFEELGVSAGDRFEIEVERTDTGDRGTIPCTVLGASGDTVAFLVGTDAQEPGENGGLSSSEQFRLADDLRVPRVSADPFTDDLVYELTAADVLAVLESRAFASENFNLPISPDTLFTLALLTVKVRAANITRNCRVPVDESVESVPALFEYIAVPEVGEDADGNIILVGKDASETLLARVPLVLMENRDYTVGDETSVAGTNAQTTAGSGIIVLPFADLVDRDVRLGDRIELKSGFDQGFYDILEVQGDETIRALSATGLVPETGSTSIVFEIHRRVAGKFLRFAQGIFTPGLQAPARFWAETTFFDNSEYIEDNFGLMVNLTKEQLDEFGSSQVTYKGAVSGLMYAWTTGPTVLNATIGAHLLLGLPVTEVVGEIVDVNDSYAEGVGRVMVEDLDSEGERTGLVRIYFYVPDGGTALPRFAGIATNPATGRAYGIGDIVPAFTPLSNGLIVADYVKDPAWWLAGGSTGAEELKKFHTWEASVDVRQVDSRDISLAFEFLVAIRPQNTKPEVVAVLFLLDEISLEDSLVMGGTIHLYDDPAFSLESTHMVDDFSGGAPLRLEDLGSFSSRTLFAGDDLIMTGGSGTVTSARGGFVSDGILPYIRGSFTNPVTVQGVSLVRATDILFLPFGPNSGRYSIDTVTDDGTLEISQLPAEWPPRSLPLAEIVDAEGQKFYIQRRDINPIASGTLDTDSTNVVIDATAAFKWDNASVDDVLILESGADYGVYRIAQVGIIDGFGDNLDLLTKLTLDVALTATASGVPYRIERDVFRRNPLHSATDVSTTAGSQIVTFPSGGLIPARLLLGDELYVQSGTDDGLTLKILDVVDDTTMAVLTPLTATEGSIVVEIRRPLLDTVNPDTDFLLERFEPRDELEMTILRPQVEHLSVADLSLAVDDATSGGTDLAAAGVTTSMTLEIDVAHSSSGVYEIASVATFTATIVGEFPIDESPVTGVFLVDDADFSVSGDTVTSVALLDYEALLILPGDILRLSVGDFVIIDVSTGTLTLSKTTGLVASVAGKIVRRTLP